MITIVLEILDHTQCGESLTQTDGIGQNSTAITSKQLNEGNNAALLEIKQCVPNLRLLKELHIATIFQRVVHLNIRPEELEQDFMINFFRGIGLENLLYLSD